jgi:hypothetical protein
MVDRIGQRQYVVMAKINKALIRTGSGELSVSWKKWKGQVAMVSLNF